MVFVLFVSFNILGLPCLIHPLPLVSFLSSFSLKSISISDIPPWETKPRPWTPLESQRKQKSAPSFEECSIIQTDETYPRNTIRPKQTTGWLSSLNGPTTNTTTKIWWILLWLASTPATVSFHPNRSITMSNGVYLYVSQDTGILPMFRLPPLPRSLHNGIRVKCAMPVWRSTENIFSVATTRSVERSVNLFAKILRSCSTIVSIYI